MALPHDPYDLLPALVPRGRTLPESHALARAISCPDRILLNIPSPQQPRIVSILAEAGRPDSRTLLLTTTPEQADNLVQLHAGSVRLLAESESLSTLPEAVAARSFHELLERRRVVIRQEHEAEISKLTVQHQELASALPIWDQLQTLEERWKSREVQKTDLLVEAEPLHVPTEPDAADDPARLELLAKLPELRKELEQLSPVVSAKRSGKIFSAAYWKATFSPSLCDRATILEAEIFRAEQLLSGSGDHTPLPVNQSPSREAILAEIENDQSSILREFQSLRTELERHHVTLPSELNAEQIASTRKLAETRLREREGEVNRLRQLLSTETDQPLADLKLFVAPRTAVTNPNFPAALFEQMIVMGAETLPTSDWNRIAPLGSRQLLIGDYSRSHREDSTNTNRTHSEEHPINLCWQVQRQLGWHRHDGMLLVRLQITVGELTPEPLADRPEIELRFGTTAKGEYVLAEVAFPASVKPLEARELLVDLGDTELMPLGHRRWHGLRIEWPWLESCEPAVWIEREPGVRERVIECEGLPFTAAVEFDATRWTGPEAEQWVEANTRNGRACRFASIVTS